MKGKRLKIGDIVMMKATRYAHAKDIVGSLAIVDRKSSTVGFSTMWIVKIGNRSMYVYRREIEYFGTTRKEG